MWRRKLVFTAFLFLSFSVNESSPSSRVWFLHCRVPTRFTTPNTPDRCPLTHMRKPLSTLCLHTFLQLMESPLVVNSQTSFQVFNREICNSCMCFHLCNQSEAHEDPSAVQPPQFPYQQTPQVFLFSHPGTEHLDLDTATTVAWRLRGLALVVLVHR